MQTVPQTLRYQGTTYDLVEAADSSPEDLKAYLHSARRAFNRLVRESGKASALRHQIEETTDDPKKAQSTWSTQAPKHPAIKKFLKRFNVTGDKEKFLLSKLRDAVFGKPRDEAWNSLRRYLEAAYIAQQREKAREPAVKAGIPKEIIEKFFPKSFAFDVAPDGKLVREFEVFGNEKKTIEAKRKAMRILLTRWNDLVDRINRDLQSTNPIRRLEALVTSIIIHTGIRPGEGGESKLKDDFGKIIRDDEGKPIRIKTVGATGIKPEHVDFVRDDFAVIEFPGKAGTKNVAELTDPNIVHALQEQIQLVEQDNEDLAFVAPTGERVTPKRINRYLRSVLGPGVTASDFRKLKATQTFYDSLNQRKHELVARFKNLKELTKGDMREQIVSAIVDYLYEAAEHAQEAISHTDVETTLEYYITPRVTIDYLAGKGVNRALDVVVGDGKELQVNFDPLDFFETMTRDVEEKAASVQRTAATLFYFGDEFVDYNVDDAIEELEEDSSR